MKEIKGLMKNLRNNSPEKDVRKNFEEELQ